MVDVLFHFTVCLAHMHKGCVCTFTHAVYIEDKYA